MEHMFIQCSHASQALPSGKRVIGSSKVAWKLETEKRVKCRKT